MNMINYKQTPKMKLRRLPVGNITASGWLRQQLDIEAGGMGGHFDELEPKMIYDPFVKRQYEQKIDVHYKGCAEPYSAEISGTYWSGLVLLAFTLDDEKLKAKVKKWVADVLANQEEDGYIGGYSKGQNRIYNKETDNWYPADFNAWSTNWAMRALLAYYEATGQTKVLKACHRGLLWFVRNWKDNYTDYVGSTLIESMIEVYLYTGDRRLVEWSDKYLRWIDAHSKQKNRTSDFTSGQLPYHTMHAVAYGEDVKHPALLYKCHGKEAYLQTSIKGLARVIDHCLQRTGAPSTNVEFLAPVGDVCETEYCDFETFERTFLEMGAITGNSEYFDLAEKIVFNGSQGAKKKDGRAIAYMSSPNQFAALRTSSVYSDAADSEVYSSFYRCACCPAHSISVIPEYVRSMCMVDDRNALYFNCYGPCRIQFATDTGEMVTVEVVTEYPFKEEIKLIVHTDKPSRMRIKLRIPGWCSGAEYSVNGKKSSPRGRPHGYFDLERTWNDGDEIELRLPMKVQAVDVDDSDFNGKAPVAIERGPLLFAYHLPEKWTVTAPVELNPHPDWPCYEVETEISQYYPKGIVLDRKSLKNATAFKVVYRDIKGAFPWEKSPVLISLKAGRAEYIYNRRMITSQSPLPTKIARITDEKEEIELVPFGCTTLRIAYFPAFNR